MKGLCLPQGTTKVHSRVNRGRSTVVAAGGQTREGSGERRVVRQNIRTNDKNNFNKDIQVNRPDGLLVLLVPERCAERHDDGNVKGCDQDQPVERRFEGSIMRKYEVGLL